MLVRSEWGIFVDRSREAEERRPSEDYRHDFEQKA
jgi:hypothetical protein